jgi:hypothetical protein
MPPGNDVGGSIQVSAAMVINDTLRISGSARGVVEGDGIPLVFRQLPGEVRLTFVDQGFVILFTKTFGIRILGINDIDNQRLRAIDQRQCGLDGLEKLGIGDQHLRFTMLQHEGNRFRIKTGVQCVEHGTGHRHAKMALEHRRRVG